jgi:hypothetical protein
VDSVECGGEEAVRCDGGEDELAWMDGGDSDACSDDVSMRWSLGRLYSFRPLGGCRCLMICRRKSIRTCTSGGMTGSPPIPPCELRQEVEPRIHGHPVVRNPDIAHISSRVFLEFLCKTQENKVRGTVRRTITERKITSGLNNLQISVSEYSTPSP